MTRPSAPACGMLIFASVAGCSDRQSVLNPRGPEADAIQTLAIVLFAGGAAILALVIVLTAVALFGRPTWKSYLASRRTIVVGGLAFPTVTLTALLAYGFVLANPVATASDDEMRIAIEGRQWWWRIVYKTTNGDAFETANELRLPVNRRIALDLSSADVIHSFWAPNIAGKMDAIPGKTTRLKFSVSQIGEARGQCAEFCGGPHALMALRVVAMDEAAFQAWASGQRQSATDTHSEGAGLFAASGCGACHTVRGSAALGRIGPDLTHVGSRLSIGADTLPVSKDNFTRWIQENQLLKPGNHMPEFKNLSAAEVDAIASYLASLK